MDTLLEAIKQGDDSPVTVVMASLYDSKSRKYFQIVFEENGLIKLDKAHSTMHDIADDLFNKNQNNEIDNARTGLKYFQIAVEHMNSVLRQCE